MRARHMSIRTEVADLRWIEEYLRYFEDRGLSEKGSDPPRQHNSNEIELPPKGQTPFLKDGEWIHPTEMGNSEINQFLTHLAVDRRVAASTQNQAFSALLFLYTQVLEMKIGINAVRAKRPDHVPVVLSIDEVRRVLNNLPFGVMSLMGGLMYGAGLRLMECCRLRVKDIDFERFQITVRDGKGEKDRMVPLPRRLVDGLRNQVEAVRHQHNQDLEVGVGWISERYRNCWVMPT